MRALEADGLVCVEPSPSDRRVRIARLTPTGLSERALLDKRSDELAASILAPLDPGQRNELVAAMQTVQPLLMTAVIEIRTVDPTDRDAVRCVRAYFAELDRRSESGFDPGAGISAEPHELVPPAGRFLIAYLRSEPAGRGAVKHHPGGPSELKLHVGRRVRARAGIGRRLLAALEACAAGSGASTVRLETNRALVQAVAMYRSTGYVEVPPSNHEPFAHHWFEKQLR